MRSRIFSTSTLLPNWCEDLRDRIIIRGIDTKSDYYSPFLGSSRRDVPAERLYKVLSVAEKGGSRLRTLVIDQQYPSRRQLLLLY